MGSLIRGLLNQQEGAAVCSGTEDDGPATSGLGEDFSGLISITLCDSRCFSELGDSVHMSSKSSSLKTVEEAGCSRTGWRWWSCPG